MRENLTYGLMRRGWNPQPFTLARKGLAAEPKAAFGQA